MRLSPAVLLLAVGFFFVSSEARSFFIRFDARLFGDQVGNGGKVIVCRNSETNRIERIELLDFYEARALYAMTYQFHEGTPQQKAKAALSFMTELDPERMERYHRHVDSFMENAKFTDFPLMETTDSDHIVGPPPGCEIDQLAIQLKPNFPNDRLFTINKKYWEAMNDDNRAGLILHEIIYKEAILRGHKNSIAVRHFNAHVASGVLQSISPEDYAQLLMDVQLYSFIWADESKNQWIFLSSVEPDWKKAEEACRDIAGAKLPEPDLVERAFSLPLRTPVYPMIKGNLFGETWTSYRRRQDGLVAVHLWSDHSIERFYRRPQDSANILCVLSRFSASGPNDSTVWDTDLIPNP